MISVRCQINIARPPAEVFAFITDPSKAILWQSSVAHAQGQLGMPAGSFGVVEIQVLGQRVSSRFEVLENDGHSYYTAKSQQGPVQYRTTQHVEPENGGSRMTYQTSIDAGTVFRLAETALESIAQARFESDLATLKAILEAENEPTR